MEFAGLMTYMGTMCRSILRTKMLSAFLSNGPWRPDGAACPFCAMSSMRTAGELTSFSTGWLMILLLPDIATLMSAGDEGRWRRERGERRGALESPPKSAWAPVSREVPTALELRTPVISRRQFAEAGADTEAGERSAELAPFLSTTSPTLSSRVPTRSSLYCSTVAHRIR